MDETEKIWQSKYRKYYGRYTRVVSEGEDSRLAQVPKGLEAQQDSWYTKQEAVQGTTLG